MAQLSKSSTYPLLLAALFLTGAATLYSERTGGDSKLANKAPMDATNLKPAAKQISIQVPQALKTLNKWRKKNPEKSDRFIHVVYWTPQDKPAAPHYQQRLDKIFVDIQEFYRSQMEALGFGADKTIGLDRDRSGALKIHFVKGLKNYDQYATASGPEIRKECLNTLRKAGINASEETLVIFCNMSVWDAKRREISQNSPYYASGSSTSGTAWQVDSPILDLKDITNKGDHVRDGQYGEISLGKYNTIFIGGIVHELGHALGLPHNLARADEAAEFGTALMGAGNLAYKDELRGSGKGAFITLAHGLKLASHPMFSGFSARMNEDPETKVENITFSPEGKGFSIRGRVTGSIPPYAVLAYMDPSGGSNYDATTTSCIPSADGRFELSCQALKPGKSARLHLVFLHVNGKATSFHSPSPKYSYPYSVDTAGNANIDLVLKQQSLEPVVKALIKGEDNPLSKLPRNSSKLLKAHAQRLINSNRQERLLPAPADVLANKKKVVLTDCKYESLKVGYGKPLFDRAPGERMLLISANDCYSSGLFAHAESRAVYHLGGKWIRLNGACGALEFSSASVGFKILADGKEIFHSEKKGGEDSSLIDLDLTGVKTLELVTTDGGNGIHSDWSTWFDMKLSR